MLCAASMQTILISIWMVKTLKANYRAWKGGKRGYARRIAGHQQPPLFCYCAWIWILPWMLPEFPQPIPEALAKILQFGAVPRIWQMLPLIKMCYPEFSLLRNWLPMAFLSVASVAPAASSTLQSRPLAPCKLAALRPLHLLLWCARLRMD